MAITKAGKQLHKFDTRGDTIGPASTPFYLFSHDAAFLNLRPHTSSGKEGSRVGY